MSSRRAFLLGAYGGEHIGDAAVLGGVLIRLARREQITRATVASFNPDRTNRLLSTIEPAVPVDVVPSRPMEMRRQARDADLLVWAGGPVGDWPRLLARNLTAAATARVRGAPFIMEGIGFGRCRRWSSRQAIRALLKLATATTVRSTAAAAAVAKLTGRPVEVVADPAFEYLATRAGGDRMTAEERRSLHELASMAPGTRLICVNVRPPTRRRRQPIVAAALQLLATALTEFAARCQARIMFFPIETEADTGRDLDAGSAIAQHIPRHVDVRVWPEKPSVDGVLALLRHSDAAVTMRYHAAVFAMSQTVPTIGIDFYHRTGSAGKVSDLFLDRGEPDRVVAIGDLDPDDLVRRLAAASATRRAHARAT